MYWERPFRKSNKAAMPIILLNRKAYHRVKYLISIFLYKEVNCLNTTVGLSENEKEKSTICSVFGRKEEKQQLINKSI